MHQRTAPAPPPLRPPPPPPLPAAVLASALAAPNRPVFRTTELELVSPANFSRPVPPAPPPPRLASTGVKTVPRAPNGLGARPLPPVLATGAGGRILENYATLSATTRRSRLGGLGASGDGSVVPAEARRYFSAIGASGSDSQTQVLHSSQGAATSLLEPSATTLAYVSFKLGNQYDRQGSPPRSGSPGRGGVGNSSTIRDLLISDFAAQQTTTTTQQHRAPELRLCTIGCYSMEAFLPKVMMPSFFHSRPLVVKRSDREAALLSGRRTILAAMAPFPPRLLTTLPIDLWIAVAEHLTQVQWLSFSESSALCRLIGLDDHVCERLLKRDNPMQHAHFSAEKFYRFGAYIRLLGYRNVKLKQVASPAVMSSRGRSTTTTSTTTGAGGDNSTALLSDPPIPNFIHDLPQAEARYVVADLPSYHLAFAHDSAVGADLITKAKVEGHQIPGALAGKGLHPMAQRPTIGLLWTPPLTPMKERTVFALVHRDIKKVLSSLASVEASEVAELEPAHVLLYINRRFRYDIMPLDEVITAAIEATQNRHQEQHLCANNNNVAATTSSVDGERVITTAIESSDITAGPIY